MNYILKTIKKDFTAYKGFKWAETVGATVTAPDWKPTQECGNGLHGWLNGVGDGSIGHISDDCIWMVLETESYIDLQDKVKFESCTILHIGTQLSATKFLRGLVPFVVGMIGENIVEERYATAGYRGTATAGNYGTATAGNYGTATAGYYGTATAGEGGTATAGYRGTATAGNEGTATAGNEGTATAGNYGTATAGYRGTATAGNEGTATAGNEGTATAGYYGIIQLKYWESRWKVKIGYIGEEGLLPDTPYKLDENHNFVAI